VVNTDTPLVKQIMMTVGPDDRVVKAELTRERDSVSTASLRLILEKCSMDNATLRPSAARSAFQADVPLYNGVDAISHIDVLLLLFLSDH